MARIILDEERLIERPSLDSPVRATYSVVDIDGERLLQIDSYGSADRAMPGKVSQSVQFDAAARAQLRALLDRCD